MNLNLGTFSLFVEKFIQEYDLFTEAGLSSGTDRLTILT